jgi:hypothetical protein
MAWLVLCLEADDALGDDDTDFNMITVFENHVEVKLKNSRICFSETIFDSTDS